MLFSVVLALAVILQNSAAVKGYEYCKKGIEEEICRSTTRRHIVCFKEQIEPIAKYLKHYPMTDHFRKLFLFWHNHYRNKLACGKIKGLDGILPRATRLRELVWDYELEYIASVHAGRCNMRHDRCRNTQRIPYSGQNLARRWTTGMKDTPQYRAERSVTMWFEEAKDVPLRIIKEYERVEGPPIGHFTVMSNDRVGRVGCSMVSCTGFPGDNEGSNYNFVTCNYDYNNLLTEPVYSDGPTASACKDFGVGKSSKYTCLCAGSFPSVVRTPGI